MMEFYTETHPKARKEHTCHICRGKIRKGERYSRESGKYEGEFSDRVTCKLCYLARDDHFNYTGDNEYDTWNIQDYLHEEHCRYCSEEEKAECDYLEFDCPIIRRHYEERMNKLWEERNGN